MKGRKPKDEKLKLLNGNAGHQDIEGLPRCSYWFEHRVTGEIRGMVQQPVR